MRRPPTAAGPRRGFLRPRCSSPAARWAASVSRCRASIPSSSCCCMWRRWAERFVSAPPRRYGRDVTNGLRFGSGRVGNVHSPPSTRIVRHVPAGEGNTVMATVTFDEATRLYPGSSGPPSTSSTSRSVTASSSSSSAPPAAASPPRCACSPASRTSTAARSASATATSPTWHPRTATSRWCSRTTRSTRT